MPTARHPVRPCHAALRGTAHDAHEWGSPGTVGYPSTLSWCEGIPTPPPAPVEEAVAPAAGVPVVDLTLMVRQLYVRAEQAREGAVAAVSLAAGLRAEAEYLEALAATLDGSVAAGFSPPGIREG